MFQRILFISGMALFLAACNPVAEPPFDHPAYHNPTVQSLTDAIAANPKDPELYFQRSIALSHINQDSLSLADLEKAVKLAPENPQYIQAIGFIQLNLERPEEAVRAFRKSLELTPKDPRVRLLLAQAYIAANDLNNAQKHTLAVLKQRPGYSEAILTDAQIRAAQKDTTAAIAIVKDLLARDSLYYDASLQLADWYKTAGNPLAIAQYQRTFAIDTTDATPLYEIGRFYEQNKELEKAKLAFRACVLNDPDYTYAYIHYGDILMKQDSFGKAENQYALAIKRDPANADAWYGKGSALEKLKQPDSARKYYNQALVFDPGLVEAAAAMKRLNSR